MKRISVKFQQQEQIYRSLHAAARSLLSSKGRVFLLFLLFYKVLTNFLFVPALQLIWALTLRFAPIQYLNNKTASRIFASPAIIGCIAVLAVLAAFWSLYEIAAMLQLLTRVRHGEPLRVGAVFRLQKQATDRHSLHRFLRIMRTERKINAVLYQLP